MRHTTTVPAVLDGHALLAEVAAAVGRPSADFRLDLVEGEITVHAPDRVQASSIEAAVRAHSGTPLPLTVEEQADSDAGTQLLGARAKAREVAAGNGTFTAAQVQKILAHLILRATRDGR